ncbi:MAG: succinylglutamate desuccinylase/aspartoacylase family protein [Verrucomicrobiota bacterium]
MQDPLENVLAPLNELARQTAELVSRPLVDQSDSGEATVLPSYLYFGPKGGGDPIRIGLFAGIHGDERAGVHGLVEFVQHLVRRPELAQGYQLFLYPICNPTGFRSNTRHSASGKDLNREFWIDSREPEVRLLEGEIRARNFHGLVSLHADDTSDGMYGFVRGAVLSKGLLEPALAAAEKVLPRNTGKLIDGFPAENGIISQCYDGILTSPPELHPLPFEIILETPHLAPEDRQREACVAALLAVLAEYQKLLAFAADL